MHEPGETRSRNRPDHLLQAPESFVRTPLPCLSGGLAIVHAAPALGCGFAQYTVEFEEGGVLRDIPGLQRFLYLLVGTAIVSSASGDASLAPGGFAYLSSADGHRITASAGTRAVIIERPAPPGKQAARSLIGTEHAISDTALAGDTDVQVRVLLPEGAGLDFAVNTMTYQPGASLAMVEVHVMEHGLLMLAGWGIYRLGEFWYPVRAGDFIWMAPFCPQWFGALGKQPAKYLIYKDWNCQPLAAVEGPR